MFRLTVLLSLCSTIFILKPVESLQNYTIVYEWTQLDYAFRNESEREEWIQSGNFIPANNLLTGIKLHGDRMFLTVPRRRRGVPATLLRLPYNCITENMVGAKLEPFPSWAMNAIGNCNGALQSTQSMEIDQFGRMWIIDTGRVFVEESNPDNQCPPKLWIIDLSNDTVIHTFEFPPKIVNREKSVLNDIVVGCRTKNDCWAYITDSGIARIVVYSLTKDRAWYVAHDASMKVDPKATNICIEGKNYTFNTPVDSIALSPISTGFSHLLYKPLSSYDLYLVNTAALRVLLPHSQYGLTLTNYVVQNLGRMPSQSDGMVMDADGRLYYGQLSLNAVYSWDTKQGKLTDSNQFVVIQNDTDLQWPDTFAMNTAGDVFVTSNKLPRFRTNTYNFTDINFRVIRFHVGSKNYMYSDGS